MKRLFSTMFVGLMLTIGAYAQTGFENYVGVQFTRNNVSVNQPNFKFNRDTDLVGVNASTTYFTGKNLGFTGEVTASTTTNGASNRLYTALVGPTVKFNRSGRFQPFVRGLVGVAAQKADSDRFAFPRKSDFSYAYVVGAGVDLKGKRFGWRVVHVDYLQTNNFGEHQANLRIGTGLTF